MSVNGLNTSITGLYANQFRTDVTANNVANINTDNFKASEVTSSDRAYINDIGTGTRITGTYAPPRPGPQAMDSAAPATAAGPAMVEQSNTDLATETINRMSARNAYGANTAMFRTADDVSQTLLDLKR